MKRIQGFTIVEMIVTMGILSILLAIGYIRLTSAQRRAPLSATIETIAADLRGQQTKAMTGETQGAASDDNYGISFQTNQYILFKGSAYNPADTKNMVFPLPDNVTANTTFPAETVVFTKGSGDVLGFSESSHTLTIVQTITNESKTMTINRYGTITSVE